MQKLRLFKFSKISIHLYCGSHDGGQENAPSPFSLFSLVQMTSNLVQRHVLWCYRPYQNLGQIDHNLHNHVFDDVICKPPIVSTTKARVLSNGTTKPMKFTFYFVLPGVSCQICCRKESLMFYQMV